MYGQQADLYGLATNTAFPHVYGTCCDSDKVTVWSAATRKVGLYGLLRRGPAAGPQDLERGAGDMGREPA